MSNNDKWSMFKNYMHNELGISKDDIRVWMKEAIQVEAEKIIKQSFEKYDINKILTDVVSKQAGKNWGYPVRDYIMKLVAEAMVKKIDLKIKD